jgi:hypothetical protein
MRTLEKIGKNWKMNKVMLTTFISTYLLQRNCYEIFI